MGAPYINDRVANFIAPLARSCIARFALRQGSAAAMFVLSSCATMAVAAPLAASGASTSSAFATSVVLSTGAAVDPVRPDIRPLLSDAQRLSTLQEGKRLRSTDATEATSTRRPLPTAEPATAKASGQAAKRPADQANTKQVTKAADQVSDKPVEKIIGKTAEKIPANASVTADGVAVFALVTDITHTRVASELRQQLMGSSATVGDLPGTPRTELMQVSTGWRAVVWPFATENEADKARRMLAERGIRTELLKF